MTTDWRTDAYWQCLSLAHDLGQPKRGLVTPADGSVSVRLSDDYLAVSTAGSSLGTMSPRSLVRLSAHDLTQPLYPTQDASVPAAPPARGPLVRDQCVASGESPLHATIHGETNVTYIARTRPDAVHCLLQADRADLLVDNVDPRQAAVLRMAKSAPPASSSLGHDLADATRTLLRNFRHQHGSAPRIIFAGHHGMFVLANSTADVLALTAVANHAARAILANTAERSMCERDQTQVRTEPPRHRRQTETTAGPAVQEGTLVRCSLANETYVVGRSA